MFYNDFKTPFEVDPLRQTDLDDCADAFIMAAKNSSLTGQNIQIGRVLGLDRFPY